MSFSSVVILNGSPFSLTPVITSLFFMISPQFKVSVIDQLGNLRRRCDNMPAHFERLEAIWTQSFDDCAALA